MDIQAGQREFGKLPQPPNKLSIIPIHASDRGTFKRCRRRWHWSSPMRENLVPRADLGGVYLPLWFGSGVHWALAQHYDPMLRRDPVETFKTWWELQWHGGVCSEEWLTTSYDRKPRAVIDETHTELEGMYHVQGLKDIIGDIQQEEFEEHRDLGIGMLTFYKEYIREHDRFTVIAAEHTFSVPILNPETGEPLVWVDHRDGQEKAVHLRGTQDAIIQDNESGRFGILEHKTAAVVNEDYFVKLDKDEQCSTYMYAGQREAEEHGLPYEQIDFVLYNALRKAYPKPPTELKNGLFSINRTTESTTFRMLEEFIEDHGIAMMVEMDPKLSAYVDYVKDSGDKQFIQRDLVRRNQHEIQSVETRLYWEVLDMLNDPRLYPNPTGDWMCLRCPFRAPCIAVDDGSNWQMMIEENYEKNWNR
jgi:hypothetical protein